MERNKAREGEEIMYMWEQSLKSDLGLWNPHHSDMWLTPDAEGPNQAGT